MHNNLQVCLQVMMFPSLKHVIRSRPLLAIKKRSLSDEAEHKIHALVTGPPGEYRVLVWGQYVD